MALDNDKAGLDATKRIESTIKASGCDISVKIASLPSAIKDPDQMIKTSGIDSFKDAISNAKTTVASQQQTTDIHKQNASQALHPSSKPATINKDKDFDMAD